MKHFAEGFFFNELRKQEMIMCFDPRSVLTPLSVCLSVSVYVCLSVCLCLCQFILMCPGAVLSERIVQLFGCLHCGHAVIAKVDLSVCTSVCLSVGSDE